MKVRYRHIVQRIQEIPHGFFFGPWNDCTHEYPTGSKKKCNAEDVYNTYSLCLQQQQKYSWKTVVVHVHVSYQCARLATAAYIVVTRHL